MLELTEVSMQIDGIVQRSKRAFEYLREMSQEEINKICEAMALAGLEYHMDLAQAAVNETGRGIVEDKAIKNLYASEYIWNAIRDHQTVGVIERDDEKQLIKIAEPVGIVAGVTPVTNPTSTVIFKSLIAVHARNPIVFGFHPQAQNCCVQTAKLMLEAAVKAGAPEDVVAWIEEPSIEATNALMHHPDVATILATGGPGMVKAAYSSGKPALGVGAGNGPSYIEKTANLDTSLNDLVLSKTFDNGMICSTENSIVVDDEIYDEVKKRLKDFNVYFVPKEKQKTLANAMYEESGRLKGIIAGKSAYEIAKLADIQVAEDTKILIAEVDEIGEQEPLSREKLCPVLSMYRVMSTEEGFDKCRALLEFGGLGHTVGIHTEDMAIAEAFGMAMPVCRVLVNQPASIGGIGDLYNNMEPSLTLGTGSYGGNSISHNVSDYDLINIKIVSKRRNTPQWVKLPSKVYFEKHSIRYLTTLPNIHRVSIVCDPGMMQLGYTDRVVKVLEERKEGVAIDIFSDVEPNPSTDTVYKGVERMRAFKPDTIIALGGGSAMDAAKFMWVMYEDPEVSFEGAKQKFLDIEKRVYRFKKAQKSQYIGIPTTSGTGSEVTPYAVITDSDTHVKYPITDYAMQPDIAIVDSQFIETVPPHTIALTGLDVISHATESFVSTMATAYTKGWSLEALRLAFTYLEKAYDGDIHAREQMHNASTMAGMAFANAFLGINHSIAHKLGGAFDLPHGLAIAITYPYVVRYNAQQPRKLSAWPRYESFTAKKDYATIARYIGIKGRNDDELVENFIKRYIELTHHMGLTLSLEANGVSREAFEAHVDELARLSYEDQCTPANPKQPLISELKEILEREWDGAGVEK